VGPIGEIHHKKIGKRGKKIRGQEGAGLLEEWQISTGRSCKR